MKQLLIFGSFIAIIGSGIAQAPFVDKTCDISCMEQKGKAPLVSGITKSIVPPNYDLKWHRLYLEVNPAVRYLQGNVTSRLTPTVSGVNEIFFDCSDSLTVDSVYFEGLPVSFSRPGNHGLRINLPQSMMVGTNYTTVVYYQGDPGSSGFGSFVQDSHSGTPIIWTLSEPYGARDWWPCKQSLNDKFDSVDVIVKTPAMYRAASNGLLLSEQPAGGSKEYHWRHRFPIPAYLVSIAVTNYVYYYDYVPYSPTDSIAVLNYVYPESLAVWQGETQDIVAIMPVFNQKFGLYPYHTEKYGHAQFNWGGGMEHTTMSSMGSAGFEILAHELAHQWFGDMITCRTWDDIWLNEGFATYLTGLSYEALSPNMYWPLWKAGQHGYILSAPDGSVKVDDTTSTGRIFDGRLTYSKGAYMLHMLRWIMGDADFYTALNNYLNDPALRFSYATTAQLKAHLETVHGSDLTYFFNDWYTGQGYPIFDVSWNQDGGGVVGIQLNQTTSHPSVSFFELPVPVRFYGGGQDTTITYNLQTNGEWFFSQLDFTVDSLRIDPDLHILSVTSSISLGMDGEEDIPVVMYPNPAQESVTFQVPPGADILSMTILDMAGKVCMQDVPNGNSSWTTDIRRLASGTYVVRLMTGKGIVYRKLLKN